MKDPWKELARTDRRKRRAPAWLHTLGGIGAAVVLVATLAAALTGLSAASGATDQAPVAAQTEITALRREVDDLRGRLALAEVQVEHQKSVAKYSSLYDVPADLAQSIYDIALAEGVPPALGFQLVKVESGFRPDARSERGAIGFTQLMMRTARIYAPHVTEQDLLDRETNLRLGFRFMKDLLARFDNDIQLALLAYNRGPTRVTELMTRGENPSNGYAEAVLRVRKGS